MDRYRLRAGSIAAFMSLLCSRGLTLKCRSSPIQFDLAVAVAMLDLGTDLLVALQLQALGPVLAHLRGPREADAGQPARG
jgi:hypothetical protein